MAKPFKCSNCGSTTLKTISETLYECAHCGTQLLDQPKEVSSKKVQEEVNKALKNQAGSAQAAYFESARKTQKVVLFVTLTIIIIGILYGIYASNKATDDAKMQMEEMQKQVMEQMKNNE